MKFNQNPFYKDDLFVEVIKLDDDVKQSMQNSFQKYQSKNLHQNMSNFQKIITLFTTHSVTAGITATLCLGSVAAFASQAIAPESLKPSNIVGVLFANTTTTNSSSISSVSRSLSSVLSSNSISSSAASSTTVSSNSASKSSALSNISSKYDDDDKDEKIDDKDEDRKSENRSSKQYQSSSENHGKNDNSNKDGEKEFKRLKEIEDENKNNSNKYGNKDFNRSREENKGRQESDDR
jgi:hypothetical protein